MELLDSRSQIGVGDKFRRNDTKGLGFNHCRSMGLREKRRQTGSHFPFLRPLSFPCFLYKTRGPSPSYFLRAFMISSQVGMTSIPLSVTISLEMRKLYFGDFLVTPRYMGRTT